jgi:flavin reductase (DIM6/NTAB) family NADH-FMN oxidoreductase RutF
MNLHDGAQRVPDAQFRSLMSRFASGVTVVTTVDDRRRAHGMTVTAFSSLSLDPPLVLICVDRAASMLEVLDTAGFFAVNILSDSQGRLSRQFSREEMELRFEGVPFHAGATSAPLIDGAHAVIECRRHARHDVGDHTIFVGLVVSGELNDTTAPLVFHRGIYGRLER